MFNVCQQFCLITILGLLPCPGLCHCLYALKELSYVLGFISGFKEVAGINYVDKRGMIGIIITYLESNLRRGYHSHFAKQDTILFCE